MSVELQSFQRSPPSSPQYDASSPRQPSHDNSAYQHSPTTRHRVTRQGEVDLSMPSTDKLYESSTDVADSDENSCFNRVQCTCIDGIESTLDGIYTKHKRVIWICIYTTLILLYAAYFAYAMYYTRLQDEDSIRLCWMTILIVVGVLVYVVWVPVGDKVSSCMRPCMDKCSEYGECISWAVVLCIYVFFIVFVIVDALIISNNPYNLVSGSGIIVHVFLFFVFSKHPSKVKWRPVVWGLAIQFILALIILRWDFGYQAFVWLGNRVAEFLDHTDAGSSFVFGDQFRMHFFAFKVLPVVIFFSTFVSVMYYLGAMQVVIRIIASGMQTLMGTSASESINAAGNIFIGQSEAPLLIKPLLKAMTKSELHAVMTGGFATIAGSVMAAYISFGVPPNHLISASVMSAPAALAMAKLFWPETEEVQTTEDIKTMEKGPEHNIVEAASAGASAAISLVANIAANLIAFMAILHFVNHTLCWFMARVGIMLYPECRALELVFSYVLWPFAVVMGADLEDCRQLGALIGIKTTVNEFVAYTELGKIITNTDVADVWTTFGGSLTSFSNQSAYLSGNITIPYVPSANLTERFTNWYTATGSFDHNVGTDTLIIMGPFVLLEGIMTQRSIVIATYALCGFSNFGSIGVMLGALGAMAPERKADISATVMRAMIAGNVACFMTACIAGLLFKPI